MQLRPKVLIPCVAVVAVALAGMFAWDASRKDLVAAGVSVGPVDVGGLRAPAARERLQERLVEQLERPLVLSAAGRDFPLSAREAKLRTDVDAMVDAAVARGREGGVLARTWRAVGGAEVDASVRPAVQFSRRAVQRVVDRVRVAVSREPVDAKVEFGRRDVSIRAAREGRSIDVRRLRANVHEALVTDVGKRRVQEKIRRTAPKVSGAQLARKYPVIVTVDRASYRLSLYKRLERVKTYPIAVGQAGLETPAGLYKIQNKAVNPAWSVPNSPWAGSLAGQVIPGGIPSNPLKARWLGIYDGVGVHGTDARGSIGTNASHGCIRMLVEHVTELYDQVPVGAPIYIA